MKPCRKILIYTSLLICINGCNIRKEAYAHDKYIRRYNISKEFYFKTLEISEELNMDYRNILKIVKLSRS